MHTPYLFSRQMETAGFRRHISDVGLNDILLYVGGDIVVGKRHQEEVVATALWAACRYQLSLGANNDQAELRISSGERFVVSSSTTGPSLIANRRQASSLF